MLTGSIVITQNSTAVSHILFIPTSPPDFKIRISSSSTSFPYNTPFNYKLEVKESTLPISIAMVEKTFDVTYVPDCTSATISYTGTANNLNYNINDPILSRTFSSWTILPA